MAENKTYFQLLKEIDERLPLPIEYDYTNVDEDELLRKVRFLFDRNGIGREEYPQVIELIKNNISKLKKSTKLQGFSGKTDPLLYHYVRNIRSLIKDILRERYSSMNIEKNGIEGYSDETGTKEEIEKVLGESNNVTYVVGVLAPIRTAVEYKDSNSEAANSYREISDDLAYDLCDYILEHYGFLHTGDIPGLISKIRTYANRKELEKNSYSQPESQKVFAELMDEIKETVKRAIERKNVKDEVQTPKEEKKEEPPIKIEEPVVEKAEEPSLIESYNSMIEKYDKIQQTIQRQKEIVMQLKELEEKKKALEEEFKKNEEAINKGESYGI